MSATPAFLSIAYLMPISVWWFVQISMVSQMPDPLWAPFGVRVLQTLIVVQLLCLSLFVPHWVKPKFDARKNAPSIVGSLLPAWPLLTILCLATGVSAAALVATQVATAGVGLLVAGAATLVYRLRLPHETLRLSQASLGLASAMLAWSLRAEWLNWIA